MQKINYNQMELLWKAMKIMNRDGRRPNGDSWSDAVHELNKTNQIDGADYDWLDHFRELVDFMELQEHMEFRLKNYKNQKTTN